LTALNSRRRSQQGSVELQGRTWSLRLRVDEINPATAAPIRRERKVRLGSTSEIRSRAQARRAADLIVERLCPREIIPGTRIRASEYFDRYRQRRIALAKPATRAAFGTYVSKHLEPEFRALSLEQIDIGAAQKLIARLAGEGLARSTIRGILALLKRIIETAQLEGFAASALNLKHLTFPSVVSAEIPPRCFTLEESSRIIEAAAWPWRALYAILAYTGLRSGEALGIAWQHVDFANRRLLIRQAAASGHLQTLKSKNSRADLAMPAPLAQILERYRAEWQDNPAGLLFPAPRGGVLWSSGVRRAHLAPLLKRLGVPHGSFHAFRHGMATNLFAAGASAPTVRLLLRHGDIHTTLRYSHTTDEQLRSASDAVGLALSRSQKPVEACP
jgi:integrase